MIDRDAPSATAAALAGFTPATQNWFVSAFGEPTPVQSAAWEAIQAGDCALVIAPTRSGKTLADFLHAIDRLFRSGSNTGAGGTGRAPAPVRKCSTSPRSRP